MTTFAQLGVPRDLDEALVRDGITAGFPIQVAALSPITEIPQSRSPKFPG